MTSFQGEWHQTISDKGRVSIPKGLRETIATLHGGKLILTRNPRCLEAYPPEEWAEIEGRIGRLSKVDPDVQGWIRFVYSAATEVELDSQGRILIPPHLRTSADLTADIVILGVQNKLEIWSKPRWESAQQNVIDNWDRIVGVLSGKGL